MYTNGSIICVVDDDLNVRRALRRLLKSMGFKVEIFGSGPDFLARCQVSNCGCLLLDIRMPGMSGFDLWEQLVDSDCDIPVIFMTAYGDTRMRERAMAGKAVAYLQKPLDDRSLLDAIYSALERGTQKQNFSECCSA